MFKLFRNPLYIFWFYIYFNALVISSIINWTETFYKTVHQFRIFIPINPMHYKDITNTNNKHLQYVQKKWETQTRGTHTIIVFIKLSKNCKIVKYFFRFLWKKICIQNTCKIKFVTHLSIVTLTSKAVFSIVKMFLNFFVQVVITFLNFEQSHVTWNLIETTYFPEITS